MKSITVNIRISVDEYLKVYQGIGRDVFTHDIQGRSVRFPAKILQKFVTHNGIQGLFEIQFDDNGRFNTIHRLESL